MFPVGGVGVMLLGIALAGAACAALAVVLRPRTGAAWAWSLALLVWSLAAIGERQMLPRQTIPIR